VRSDENLPEAFSNSDGWVTDPASGEPAPQFDRLRHYYGPDYHRHSYSGHERNKLFINQGGNGFADLSPLSGADTEADSRSWCALDYDGDGFTDIAVVNANTPLLNLFRNGLGKSPGAHGFIGVRLVGGADASGTAQGWSNRDAVGARITVTLEDGTTLSRSRRCGEGFAAQNSATLLIGIGAAAKAAEIRVDWPSGKVSTTRDTAARSLVTFTESDGAAAVRSYLQR
jgi:hypothetical protein